MEGRLVCRVNFSLAYAAGAQIAPAMRLWLTPVPSLVRLVCRSLVHDQGTFLVMMIA